MLLLFLPVRLVLARDAYAFAWGAVTLIAYGLIVAGGWKASQSAGKLTRALVRGGFLAGAAWSWGMSAYPGSLSWRAYTLYAIGSIIITVISWMLIGLRDGDPQWSTMNNVEHVRKALDRVRAVNAVKAAEGRAEARIESLPGVALEDLDRKALAATYGVPVGGVVVRADDDSSTRGTLIVDPRSMRQEAVKWMGPSFRPTPERMWGSLVTDPIAVGPESRFYLAGDHKKGRNASHIVAVGMSGAGKTIFIKLTVLEGMTRGPAFEYDYADSRKGNQASPWLRDGARRVATTKEEVAALLADLRSEELPRREKLMGAASHEQWTEATWRELGIPFRLVVLDELAGVATDIPKLLTDISETCRSLGVLLLLGFQRITHDRMPTSLRANIGTTACFGVKDSGEAENALTDSMAEAGARPELWQNRVPGMHYLEAPGDDNNPGKKLRTFAPNDQLMDKWAAWLIARRRVGAPTDEVARREAAPRPARASRDAVEPAAIDPDEVIEAYEYDEEDDDLSDYDAGDDIDEGELTPEESARFGEVLDALDRPEDDEDDEDDPELDRVRRTLPPDLAAEVEGIDLRRGIEVDDASTERLISQRPKMPEDQARALLKSHVAAFASRGLERFRADDECMVDVLLATGYGPSWLRKWLDRLADEGELITKRGPRLGYNVRKGA